MTVCELRKALEQFAPNAEVCDCDLTPIVSAMKFGDCVLLERGYSEERETNP